MFTRLNSIGCFALLAASCVLTPAAAWAQDKHALKNLVGFPPGGSADVIARLLGDAMRDDFSSIIAVTGDKRDPQVPEVPTLKESGVNMVATAWFAMYGPAGLSADTVARLEKAVVAAIRKPAVEQKLLSYGYDPVGSTSAELAAIQRTDLARWEKPIKATGIQLD